MPAPLKGYSFRELVLLDSAELGLRPEDTSRSTPLALVPLREQRVVDRGGSSFMGWTRVYIGMWSMPRQLRLGRWQTREDLAWPERSLSSALRLSSIRRPGNPMVAVASVWAPVQKEGALVDRVPRLAIGPPLNPLFAKLQWLAMLPDLPGGVLEDYSVDQLFFRQHAKPHYLGQEDPRNWRQYGWNT